MNIKTVIFNLLLSIALLPMNSFAQKTVAITIDDLPFVGEARNFHLNMIMNTLLKEQVPAIGFIIASEVHKENWDALQQFRDAGFGLGNHTYSHANLNRMDTKNYVHDIKQADKVLSPVLSKPKYFRYPYLAMSSGIKRNEVLCYLEKRHYQVAPITIDSKDFAFNQRLLAVPELGRRAYLEELKPFYLDFIWHQTLKAEEHSAYHHNPEQAQILLIHANLLNAYVLPDLIKRYRQEGYRFVSLKSALKTFKDQAVCSRSKPKMQETQVAKAESEVGGFAWD